MARFSWASFFAGVFAGLRIIAFLVAVFMFIMGIIDEDMFRMTLGGLLVLMLSNTGGRK